MAIYLIVRKPDGHLRYTENPGAYTDNPQIACNRYKGPNTPVAWTRQSPAGRLQPTLDEALAAGQGVRMDDTGSRWIAALPAVQAAPVQPKPVPTLAASTHPKDLAMIARDASGVRAHAAGVRIDGVASPRRVQPKPVPVKPVGPCIHPPFNHTSPDLVYASHQLSGAFGSAALI